MRASDPSSHPHPHPHPHHVVLALSEPHGHAGQEEGLFGPEQSIRWRPSSISPRALAVHLPIRSHPSWSGAFAQQFLPARPRPIALCAQRQIGLAQQLFPQQQ